MVGGIFRILDPQSMAGKDYRQEGVTRWYYQLAWGTVSRKPELTMRERDKLPCVRFSICWRRNQYINYRCWADNPFAYEIAQRLLLGDPVIVCSHGSEKDYVPKKGRNVGRQRISREGRVHIIFPMRLMAGILIAMQDAAEAPDILAGLEEYLKQSAEESNAKEYEIPF